ncbi:Uma2 family endonuclease [bacterium]|nr:MAG: Uma2 family endonuclease [bacterium]
MPDAQAIISREGVSAYIRTMVVEAPRKALQWTFEQFMGIAEAGLFDSSPHLELIDGLIYEKMPQKHPHFFTVSMLLDALKEIFGRGSAVSSQSTVRLGPFDGPEPDLAVFRGKMADYRHGFPKAEDVVLFVEVGDSTFDEDLRDKAPLYARFGIPEFWLVDVKGRRILVHRSPDPDSSTWGEVFEVGEGDSICPLHQEPAVIVSDILPARGTE